MQGNKASALPQFRLPWMYVTGKVQITGQKRDTHHEKQISRDCKNNPTACNPAVFAFFSLPTPFVSLMLFRFKLYLKQGGNRQTRTVNPIDVDDDDDQDDE
jgi:hypothetical protein